MTVAEPLLKKITLRKRWFLALCLFGLLTSIAGIILEICLADVSSIQLGYQTGGGIALFVIGLLRYFQIVKLEKNQSTMKKLEAEHADERLQLITMKAYSMTGFIMNLLLYCATCIVGYWNFQLFITLFCVLVIQLVMFTVSKIYFSIKY